jgi:phenylpropionate dioxygenase-like ring-hydroxylating dioxygenase large terminal subunit
MRTRPRTNVGRRDWKTWPHYDAAVTGFRGWWYPVAWSSQVTGRPKAVTVLDERLVLIRDRGTAYALHDRCPHRGVPLSLGNQQFPGTISCAYHGWTYGLADGVLKAVITDGPDSPICGKVRVRTYPVAERLGMVWLYVGDDESPSEIDRQLPEELFGNRFVLGGRIQPRAGNWRFACENGFDEGHAKFLHRTSLWRMFKPMPVWNETRLVRRGRWVYRVQERQHWNADFRGLGRWTNLRWWRMRPPSTISNIGNTGAHREVDPVIAAQAFPGFASVTMPGILRIVYPNFIHYEFYVPVDADRHLYVGVMVSFAGRTGSDLAFVAKYLGAVRWLFHGNFSHQDAWMVEATNAPPERLYRPDSSLIAWRQLAEESARERDSGGGQ